VFKVKRKSNREKKIPNGKQTAIIEEISEEKEKIVKESGYINMGYQEIKPIKGVYPLKKNNVIIGYVVKIKEVIYCQDHLLKQNPDVEVDGHLYPFVEKHKIIQKIKICNNVYGENYEKVGLYSCTSIPKYTGTQLPFMIFEKKFKKLGLLHESYKGVSIANIDTIGSLHLYSRPGFCGLPYLLFSGNDSQPKGIVGFHCWATSATGGPCIVYPILNTKEMQVVLTRHGTSVFENAVTQAVLEYSQKAFNRAYDEVYNALITSTQDSLQFCKKEINLKKEPTCKPCRARGAMLIGTIVSGLPEIKKKTA